MQVVLFGDYNRELRGLSEHVSAREGFVSVGVRICSLPRLL